MSETRSYWKYKLTGSGGDSLKPGGTDRRSGKDRRNRNIYSIRTLFNGRRELIRRREDQQHILYVDRYSPTLFATIMTILTLSVVDAYLTLLLIDHGAVEVNPLLAFYLDLGPRIFFAVKYLLTCLSIFILLILRNVFFKRLKIHAGSIFSLIIVVFVTVVAWQLFLIYHFVYPGL